jgi:hypothetical protein
MRGHAVTPAAGLAVILDGLRYPPEAGALGITVTLSYRHCAQARNHRYAHCRYRHHR